MFIHSKLKEELQEKLQEGGRPAEFEVSDDLYIEEINKQTEIIDDIEYTKGLVQELSRIINNYGYYPLDSIKNFDSTVDEIISDLNDISVNVKEFLHKYGESDKEFLVKSDERNGPPMYRNIKKIVKHIEEIENKG